MTEKLNILIEMKSLIKGWSGVEKSALMLTDLLQDLGHNVEIVVDKGLKHSIFVLDHLNLIDENDLNIEKYHLVIFNSEYGQTHGLLDKLTTTQIPIIKIMHGDPNDIVRRYDNMLLKMYRFYNQFDAIVILNPNYYSDFPNVLKDRIHLISHGIKGLDDIKPSKGQDLVYFGRFDEPNKRVSLLIDAMSKSQYLLDNFKLKLYGDGYSEAQYAKMIKKHALDNVSIHAPNPNLKEVLEGTKFNVLLSEKEGFPLSILEGLTYGVLPVVSKTSRWHKGIVIPELQMDTEDSQILSEEIKRLNSLSYDEYNMLFKKQIDNLRPLFSYEKVKEEWVKLITTLTNEQDSFKARHLCGTLNAQTVATNSKDYDNLRKEHELLKQKYHYVLSMITNKKTK